MNKLANQFADSKPILNAPAKRKPRADAEKRFAALVSYIENRIISAPVELDGIQWAGPIKQADLAAELGMPISTLERYLGRPHIVRTARGMGKRKATFLRIGQPGDPAPDAHPLKKTQNAMARMWREHRRVDWLRPESGEYGLICGLAEVWPPGWQVHVFGFILKHWIDFATAVRRQIDLAQLMRARMAEGSNQLDLQEEYRGNPDFATAARMQGVELFEPHYTRRPHLPTLRLFAYVAASCFEEAMQDRDPFWTWESPKAWHK